MTDLLDRLKSALADRYSIEREIGSGGIATVYLSQDACIFAALTPANTS